MNPDHTTPSLLASTSTLNNSPISAGDSSFCTAAASRKYAADVGSPASMSRSRIPDATRNAASDVYPATVNPPRVLDARQLAAATGGDKGGVIVQRDGGVIIE